MKQIQEIKDYLQDVSEAVNELYGMVLELEQSLQQQPQTPASGLRARLRGRSPVETMQLNTETQRIMGPPIVETSPQPTPIVQAPPVQFMDGVNLGGGMKVDGGETNSNKGNREWIPPGFKFQPSAIEKLAEEGMRIEEAKQRMKGRV